MTIDWLAVLTALFGAFVGFVLGVGWASYTVPIEEHDD